MVAINIIALKVSQVISVIFFIWAEARRVKLFAISILTIFVDDAKSFHKNVDISDRGQEHYDLRYFFHSFESFIVLAFFSCMIPQEPIYHKARCNLEQDTKD